ncbi:hypothetical protein ANCCAN_26995 [Ancylostoma caninum]|uniref:Uncharacterized protein n=1 Tax=Ancylostoma caninum TaxID=29170 RepID=A0A368F574_ANCCA|nr:hypothetical protein ANCCAN_26995 [Ancylostoma caninum]
MGRFKDMASTDQPVQFPVQPATLASHVRLVSAVTALVVILSLAIVIVLLDGQAPNVTLRAPPALMVHIAL